MERSKLRISIVVGLAAILIIWRVGFYPPVPEQAEKPVETKVATETKLPEEVQKPGDADEPVATSDVGEPGGGDQRGRLVAAGVPEEPNEPNEPMEFVNLKNVEMKAIVEKLADWTGKVIIPTDESMKQRVTIYAPEKLPRSKALAKIYSALRVKGYIVEYADDTIYLKPISEQKYGEVPTILADYPLAKIENKDQVVQKFFKLKNYSASQMGEIIVPLVGEYGYVSADESTSSLLVIDTVANLLRISRIIEQFDAVKAEQTETWVFEIRHGDPSEIVELLETLLSEGGLSSRGRTFGFRGPGGGRGPGSSSRPSPTSNSSSKSKSSTKGAATSITVGTTQAPIVLIPEPKHKWIIAKASPEDIKVIGEWIERLDKSVSTVLVDTPLSSIQNKNQVVQKFFKLENYSPQQMSDVVGPLLSESGYISAEESTGNLLVIDTVENLIRIEMIIEQFDVPEAEQTVTNIFEVYNGDPSEIVQLLRMLLSVDGTGGSSLGRSSSSRSNRDSRSSYSRSSYSRTSYSRGGMSFSPSRSSSRTGSSVVVGTSQLPIVLIPEPNRKWIIARASAEDMKRIAEWIEKLDKKEPVEKEYETVSIGYADVSEVADRLNEALQQMPGTELQASVLVQPLVQARQIVIFGRADMREMVKKLIAEVDVPAGMFETRVFKLKYADPDEIKDNLEGLYEQQAGSFRSYGYSRSYSSRTVESQETVKVISFSTMQQVTVIASPENMLKIAEQIAEWDVPLDVAKVRPRIIELYNSDPIEMADLLTTLFSEESSRGLSFYDLLFGTGAEEKAKIVGPLYGQLTFEDVPGTKKIIVISKIPEAYDVIEELVQDLDKQEMGEIPKVVTLKYADPEDLSERLNAMFCEPGTSAVIVRSERGLSEYSMDESSTTSNSSQDSSTSSTTSQGQYTPWWSGAGARSSIDEEMPISNVIGRIRFVPEPRIKAILVLAPPEFMPEIEKLIETLDVPGKQVMIKAIIVEVDHSSMTSLGVQLAPTASAGLAFGTLDENTATIINQLTFLETHGSLTLSAATDVTAMIDFLVKQTNAKILNQQTLWTEDNEEASFFKGEKVAFLTSVQAATGVAGATQNYEFARVGMTLAVRPSITPENNVDTIINIVISQLTADEENGQPVRTEMETKTNMIIEDSQTIMLGGILFQEDRVVIRKVPLFGDVPVAGGLFRHNEVIAVNNEMLVFITPYVIDDSGKMLPETAEQIERPKEKLKKIQEELETTMQKLEQELP